MQAITTPFERFSAASLSPYLPSVIGKRAAERARRLSVSREPVDFAADWSLALVSHADTEAWGENGSSVELDIRIDGEPARLRTVWPVLEKLLHDAEPRLEADDLDAELSASLLESHLISAIEALESHLGVSIAFKSIAETRDAADLARLDLALIAGRADHAYPAALFGTPRLLGLLAAAWEQQPFRQSSPIEPTFLLSARVAYSSLSRAALRRLAVGDGLLFDRVAPDGGVVLCLAEHTFACAQITAEGEYALDEPFMTNSPLSLGEFSMSENEDSNSGAAALDDTNVGALPVHLVFEIGRREMSLDELREMGVGAPIPLERPAAETVDIVANGRRVGAGEMVLIGDQLGVRITRLNGHA